MLETGEEKDLGKGGGIGGAEVVWVAGGEKGEISPEERTDLSIPIARVTDGGREKAGERASSRPRDARRVATTEYRQWSAKRCIGGGEGHKVSRVARQ